MPAEEQIEGGAYEVLRARMEKGREHLAERLETLNAERKRLFGAIDFELLATERVTTHNNCVPRDMVAVGGRRFLFGYNVQLGLKSTTDVEDVFSVYDYDAEAQRFASVEIAEALGDSSFQDDFAYLFKYYRSTSFLKFHVLGAHLYMVMQIGKSHTDAKCFKWLMRETDGRLEYLGNRFEHELALPPQHEFTWTRTHRDMHRSGASPHVSIEDRVFVETVGGDLTIKVEDNTESGEGIYSEPVENADQVLDDAEFHYAIVGSLILLKILPYREQQHRYFVFNEKLATVHRIDSIADACILLPDDQGLIFPNGYLLQTGAVKTFDTARVDMRFERRIVSANGEDTLFVFHNQVTGDYVLLPYNLIEQQVESYVVCHGYSLFPGGELLYFRTGTEPQKHHAIQIWRTPLLATDHVGTAASQDDHLLAKVGNAEIVRCMAECRDVLALLHKDDTYADLYVDLVKLTTGIADSYWWTDRQEAGKLREPLLEIHGAAKSAIEEFEKVRALRDSSAASLREIGQRTRKAVREAAADAREILHYVGQLAELRTVRGEIIALRDTRYMDLAAVEALEKEAVEATDALANRTVAFLLKPEALDPYRETIEARAGEIASVRKVSEAKELEDQFDETAGNLEMLIEVVSNLKIEDSTQTTRIIDDVSEIFATLNQVRVDLRTRRRDLAQAEGAAEFHAQLRLFGQSVVNFLDLSRSPAQCEDYLNRLMVQLEELEGRFSEFDEYIAQLGEKREEVYSAFETKRQALLDKRQKRSETLSASAGRILNGIAHRVGQLKTVPEITGYLASDLMVEKVRNIVAELEELGSAVKAGDLQTRLQAIQQEAVRQLKDRSELFADGDDLIAFGRHRFRVNRQELEVSLVLREGEMGYHIASTGFFERIDDAAFLGFREFWEQEIVSENEAIYRAEYLATRILDAIEEGTFVSADEYLAMGEEERIEAVRAFMAPRYEESYAKGIHDRDARILLDALLPMRGELGLLRFGVTARAAALVFWSDSVGNAETQSFRHRLQAMGDTRRAYGANSTLAPVLLAELERSFEAFRARHEKAFPFVLQPREAARYLFEELSDGPHFSVSLEAAELAQAFQHSLTQRRAHEDLDRLLEHLKDDAIGRFQVLFDALAAFAASDERASRWREFAAESAAHRVHGYELRNAAGVAVERRLAGLKGSHALIDSSDGGAYALHYTHFSERLGEYIAATVPRFQEYMKVRAALIQTQREELRLGEHKARVLSTFVRNRLINDVYLPLIGDNLAKQLGTAGENTRTDRMGLLLLISPPGYGKTTLLEYIANRLGIAFVKINGPALGNRVVSLDPAEAPNASARDELRKLGLAFEMGDNVLICIDDIQHCSPEFLQRFIPLCDAQRRIEGVWKAKPRTYDLRGRRVAVVMAGNPYTESGGKFQIPDMLANRADTYNLGDIAGSYDTAFRNSYVENALTSNPVLAKLAARSQKDVYGIIRIAETDSQEGVDFESNYSPTEIGEMTSVMKKLFAVRDTILAVNLEYIRSASQADAYRTEPPFRLQGSYRNMARIAEKLLPLMTDAEVREIIVSHYENESQTLTTDAEANLLKFRELLKILTPQEQARWDEIKRTFQRNLVAGGAGEDDPVTRVVGQLSAFNKGLEDLALTVRDAGADHARPQSLAETTVEHIERIIAGLRAVPVNVEIKVLPVEKSGSGSPVDIQPEVKQGTEGEGASE